MIALGVDSHVHVFCPGAPFASDTRYIPHPTQQGTVAHLDAVLAAHGLTHALLVAAQPYGYDNDCMCAALAAAPARFRGIALLRPAVSDQELDRLAGLGVVGIRFNLASFGLAELTDNGAARLLDRIAERGWFLQLHADGDSLAAALPLLTQVRPRLLLDHCGRPAPSAGLNAPGFQALLALGRTGRHVLKLSGPFRSSAAPFPYADLDPYIAAVLAAFTPDRCLWGSDWPFVKIDTRMDYGPGLAWLERCLPRLEDRRKVLWEVPARLFGFDT